MTRPMVLVTGATGFIGQAVIRQFSQAGIPVRTLIKPSRKSPQIPTGIPVEVAISTLLDKRGVRAALVGVEAVIHLAGAENRGSESGLQAVDVEGTRVLASAARQAGVRRMVYLSHLGAEPASAYPALRAKAQAERHLERSRVPYTILRSSPVYGEGDHFTTALARLLAVSPLIFPLPGDGSTTMQPLWVEDLATCVLWALEEPKMAGAKLELGGPEFFTLQQVVEMVMQATGSRRWLVHASPLTLRGVTWLINRALPRPPVTPFWLDHLVSSKTAGLDALPRQFGLKPGLMGERLGYLHDHRWGWQLLREQLASRNGRRRV